jgi:hypothetical protein
MPDIRSMEGRNTSKTLKIYLDRGHALRNALDRHSFVF